MWYFLILSLTVSFSVDSLSIDSLSSAAVQKRNEESEPWKNPDLPNTIEPIQYDLFLHPNFYVNGTQFHGNVSIEINVLNRTKTIIVHKKDIEITRPRVRFHHNGSLISQANQFDYPQNDYYVIVTRDLLPIGKYKISYSFEGNMTFVADSRSNKFGLNNIPVVNGAGQRSSLLVTDFGSSNSRQVFPNFDEPRFKARFRITLTHIQSFSALSNMPVDTQSTRSDGTRFTTFKLSPKMSSYLVGFAITEFRSKNKTVNGKQYNVWAQPNALAKADYALNMAPRILNRLYRELNIVYPLPKLDQLAVPGDLLSGSKENWGLLTYKESALCFDVTRDGDSAKYETLAMIAKALAHNYFGYLVTCKHWKHVWLNEILATFYAVRVTSVEDTTSFYKELIFGWKLESDMNEDAKHINHPLTQTDFSDEPGYKGTAILRMVENFMGYSNFTTGIRNYLTRFANGVVVPDNLLLALQHVDERYNMKLIMTNWLEFKGLPVIKVELFPGNTINATQKEFLSDPEAVVDETVKWVVPLTYRSKGIGKQVVWMYKDDVSFQISLRSSTDWIEFNVDRAGYYRVHYDPDLYERLSKQLIDNHKVFTELSRSAMLSDALALANADQEGYDVFLNLTRYAWKERELTPWRHIRAGFKAIMTLSNATNLRRLESYMYNLTKPLMDKLQVKDQGSYIEKQLRPNIMTIACFSGHQGCIDNTTRLFKAWIQNPTRNAVPMNIRKEVYCIGIAFSKVESEWNTTFQRYRKQNPKTDERVWLREALINCLRNVTYLERLLELSLDENFMSQHEAFRFLLGLHLNPFSEVHQSTWNWLKPRYATIERTIGEDYAIHYFISSASPLNTQAQYQEVQDFYNVHPNITEEEKIFTNKDILLNIGRMDRHRGPITTWLERFA